MRSRAVSLSGALAATLMSCSPPETVAPGAGPVSPAGGAAHPATKDVRSALREDALRRARVWQEPRQPISAAALAANPPGERSFDPAGEVACTFVLQGAEGWTPKFDCRLPDGEEVKVKYSRNNAEVFAEVAATRLLSALGFGADRMYVVGSVRCRGCPVYPYPKVEILDAARRDDTREVVFPVAAIERKMPGRSLKTAEVEGWGWYELDRVDPRAGGASRAEVDALRLMAVFLAHWDGKATNQRLICLDAEGGAATKAAPSECARPFALLHDVGQTFGPRAVDLEGWRRSPVWADAAECRVDMKGLPFEGAGFGEARITEAGRRFLASLLRQLSRAQLVSLFHGARFDQYTKQSAEGRRPESWAAAFESRVSQIADRAPCPN